MGESVSVTTERKGMAYKARRVARSARVVAFVLSAAALMGASIVLDAPTQSNGLVAYPVSVVLDSAENAAGIQFDIDFDPAAVRVVDIQPGVAADYAGKTVVFSMYDEDTARVLVVGMNQDQLGSGVVANVYLEPVNGSAGAAQLALSGAAFSDPAGNPLAPVAEPDADDGAESSSDSAYKPADADSTGDAATANRDTATDDKTGAVSPGFMPALLDNLTGGYGPAANSANANGGSGGTSHGRGAYPGGAAAAGLRASRGAQYANYGSHVAPSRIPPRTTARQTAQPAAANPRSRIPQPDTRTGTASGGPQAGTSRMALARRFPLRMNLPPPAVVGPASAKQVDSATESIDNIDFSRYATRRSLIPAAACLLALVLVLRNACAPLWRLVRDVARL